MIEKNNRTGGEFGSRVFICAFIKSAYCIGSKGLYRKLIIILKGGLNIEATFQSTEE